MADKMPSRRPRSWRLALLILAIVALVPLAGVAILAATFDPGRYKPQIEAAAYRATGRTMAIDGKLGVKFSLWPTLEADDVSLANVAGGSRPEMAKLRRLEAQIALLPLLRHRLEISRIVLVDPDILLETDAEGRPNWRFSPAVPAQRLPATPQPSAPARPLALAVDRVDVIGGRLTWRDGRTGHAGTVDLRGLGATSDGIGAPVDFSLDAAFQGTPFALSGTVGPIEALRQPQAAPWPVRLSLSGVGGRVDIAGTVAAPAEARGYRLQLTGTAPDLAALNAFFRKAHLPPLKDVRFAATLADEGQRLPAISGVALHAGPSDLGAFASGLTLAALDIAVPSLGAPARIAASGAIDALPLAVSGTVGLPAAIGSGAAGERLPIDLAIKAGEARLGLRGTVADPSRLAGLDVLVDARIPDLAALATSLHRTLPALRDIALTGRLGDGAAGLSRGVTLQAANLRLPQGDLAGDLALAYGGRPSLRANLGAQHLDLDGLRAAWAAPSPSEPPVAGSAPAGPPPSAAAPAVPAAPAASRADPVFPDRPLPFGLLRLADADIRLSVGVLRSGGQDYHAIAGHLVLDQGRLSLDPVSAQMPGGPLEARLGIDAREAAPPVALFLRAPGLDVASLLALAGLPDEVKGAVDVDADLRATGESAHALAASLTGHLGLALVNGAVGNRLVSGTLGQVLQHAGLPDVTAHPGSLPVRCFAARLDASGGKAALRRLVLDTSLFRVEGTGSLDLAAETMRLDFRPLARLGGTGIIVPLAVQGPFRSPKVAVEADGAGAQPGGARPPLGIIVGALGGDGMVRGGGEDDCAAALAEARAGLPGAAPEPAERVKAPKPADFLRQFLR